MNANSSATSTEADGPAPDSQLVEDERAEAVRRALVELAEPYRVVVVLRHYEGLKFREIGDVLGIPEGSIELVDEASICIMSDTWRSPDAA